jgi:hypothetical protein
MQKNAKKYECEKCNFVTSNKCNYTTHLLTAKHLSLTDVNKNNANVFKCDCCCKKYKSRVGLWSHKKKCCEENKNELSKPEEDTAIIFDIIKENQEFKNLLLEQNKQVLELQKENKHMMNKMVEITQQQLATPTNITNNNHITNNQNFNLNLFLNETCKDAMNIQEFIENIKVTFEELLLLGNNGFITGLSDIFVKRLRDLEINKRPIHCTDVKRETIYFKEDDSWNKDDKDNNKLKNVIEIVENKNYRSLAEWCVENPDSRINNTPNNLLRDKIYLQALQGDEKTRERVIKNIAKEVIINKVGEFPSARIASFACRGKPRSSIDIAHRAISTDDAGKLLLVDDDNDINYK